MKKLFFCLSLLFLNLCNPIYAISETIDVAIKGVDDGVKTNKQQDYKEAEMNAKLQAIERAGVEINSITQIVNFQLKYKTVESKAKAVLLPGFNVVDIGYLPDGSYQVVLSGKVQVGEKSVREESKDRKDMRYAESLYKDGKKEQAYSIVKRLLNSGEGAVKADALYYSVIWEISKDTDRDVLRKIRAYFPNYKNLKKLESEIKHREKMMLTVIKKDGHYVMFENGVVYDEKKGLEWVAGPDKDTDWPDANNWVSNLSLANGGWRMPTSNEVQSLWEKGRGSRNITPLLKTTGYNVWVGGIHKNNRLHSLVLSGGYIGYTDYNVNIGSRRLNKRVFAVRSTK